MNAKEWQQKHGRDAALKVCEKLGVTYNYWKGIKRRSEFDTLDRNVSHQRAVELAQASDEVTGDPMTVIDLLGLRDMPERLVGKVRGAKSK